MRWMGYFEVFDRRDVCRAAFLWKVSEVERKSACYARFLMMGLANRPSFAN